jgi:hypothetical protein
MALRRGQPGASYTVTDARGLVTEIRANEDGVVRPTSGEQVRVADANNLPYWGDPLTSAERAALAAPKED